MIELPARPRGAIGGEAERLDQTRQGLIQVNMAAVRSAGSIDKLVYGLHLPFLFDSVDHLYRAIDHAGLKDRLNDRLAKGGVRILAFTRAGAPAGIFNTRRPIRSIEDMQGLRMRALDKLQIALYRTWGAQGTIVSWPEVPAALQTGVAHGYINPSMAPLIFGHTGFIRHFTDAGVVMGGRLALVSLSWFRGLSNAQRGIVQAAAAQATESNRLWLARMEPEMLSNLEKAGIVVTHLSVAARQKFAEVARRAYADGVLSPPEVKTWVDAAAAAR